jgi:hypothetical protein
VSRGTAPAQVEPTHRMCNACLTIQDRRHLQWIPIGHGFDPQLVCTTPAACRQRAQLRGVWGVTP